ncbi:zinc finger protein 721-like [Sparus aurata]|uniref:zinc finger protein 721-like n=1 Tax=Sparus aurata TaxID=8175 RepID=UPI0011C10234|nr:zinc finger protein 721-like [Sparus aurata]
MSSVFFSREFVNERLLAAAEEIFSVFKQTIIEYEEVIDRQRKLLDIVWKPEIKLHRIELPQQHVCNEEEVLTEQQLLNQERNSSLDQEDPEPPQIKEEQEELCASQEGEDSDHSEPELKSDHQLLSENSHVAESQDQKGGEHGDSGSTTDAEPEPTKTLHSSESHSDNENISNFSEIQQSTLTDENYFSCDTCGKDFKQRFRWQRHLRIHTHKRTFACKACGRVFSKSSNLKVHMRIHTGEKPYSCKTCGQEFRYSSALKVHMRVHTELPQPEPEPTKRLHSSESHSDNKNNFNLSEIQQSAPTDKKSFRCDTCGKDFKQRFRWQRHLRIHTHKRTFACKACGRVFAKSSNLKVHMRIHTGEKPYSCKTCGKDFRYSNALKVHMRIHTELPQQHVCKEEEVLAEQQLLNQERNSSLDQEDPEPPQIKEEQEELCTSQEGEQLVLKQETDAFMLTPADEDSDHSEPGLKSDHQQLSDNSHVAESQDQKGGEHGDSGSTTDAEPEPTKRLHSSESHSDNKNNTNFSEIQQSTLRDKKYFRCDSCGRGFKQRLSWQRHLRIHTHGRTFACKTCGKVFAKSSNLKVHMRIHTGEKPYSCKTCGKDFRYSNALKDHMRVHTGEKPYPCEMCGRGFVSSSHLLMHMRIHTGEKT